MISSPEEGLKKYKEAVQFLSEWLKNTLEGYQLMFNQNQLSVFHAEHVMNQYERNSAQFKEHVQDLKAMAEVLNLTDEEIQGVFREANLNTAVLCNTPLHVFIATPSFKK